MDVLTPEQRHKNMSAIRNKDSQIEIKLRQALWHRGYRYRKNYSKLPGKPDIVLVKYKITIFCDSEYFHGKEWDSLQRKIERGNNSEFWLNKISNNIKHDQDINEKLDALGWTVLRFWGNDINKKTDECVQTIKDTIKNIQTMQGGIHKNGTDS